jgi:GxxExxY protein
METVFEKDILTEKIIACCFRVHRELGPGFLEKIYHRALQVVFEEEGINYESEKKFYLYFSGSKIGMFRCDFLIDNRVIVELKAVTGIMPVLFRNQVISYLKASKVKTGLLINFGNKSCEIKRLSV